MPSIISNNVLEAGLIVSSSCLFYCCLFVKCSFEHKTIKWFSYALPTKNFMFEFLENFMFEFFENFMFEFLENVW